MEREGVLRKLVASAGAGELQSAIDEAGLELGGRDKDVLFAACNKAPLSLLCDFVCLGVDLSDVDGKGATALHLICERDLTEEKTSNILRTVCMLMQKIDVNAQDNEKCTPLHRLLRRKGEGQEVLLRLLLDHGAKMELEDVKGNSPLDTCLNNAQYAHLHSYVRNRSEAGSFIPLHTCKVPHIREMYPEKDVPLMTSVPGGQTAAVITEKAQTHSLTPNGYKLWVGAPGGFVSVRSVSGEKKETKIELGGEHRVLEVLQVKEYGLILSKVEVEGEEDCQFHITIVRTATSTIEKRIRLSAPGTKALFCSLRKSAGAKKKSAEKECICCGQPLLSRSSNHACNLLGLCLIYVQKSATYVFFFKIEEYLKDDELSMPLESLSVDDALKKFTLPACAVDAVTVVEQTVWLSTKDNYYALNATSRDYRTMKTPESHSVCTNLCHVPHVGEVWATSSDTCGITMWDAKSFTVKRRVLFLSSPCVSLQCFGNQLVISALANGDLILWSACHSSVLDIQHLTKDANLPEGAEAPLLPAEIQLLPANDDKLIWVIGGGMLRSWAVHTGDGRTVSRSSTPVIPSSSGLRDLKRPISLNSLGAKSKPQSFERVSSFSERTSSSMDDACSSDEYYVENPYDSALHGRLSHSLSQSRLQDNTDSNTVDYSSDGDRQSLTSETGTNHEIYDEDGDGNEEEEPFNGSASSSAAATMTRVEALKKLAEMNITFEVQKNDEEGEGGKSDFLGVGDRSDSLSDASQGDSEPHFDFPRSTTDELLARVSSIVPQSLAGIVRSSSGSISQRPPAILSVLLTFPLQTSGLADTTPLHQACISAPLEDILQLLCDGYTDVGCLDNKGFTALHHFVERKISQQDQLLCLQILCLFTSDADLISASSNEDETPLHRLCQAGADMFILQFLLSHGAEVTALDSNGRTPANIAVNRKLGPDVIAKLNAAKADCISQCSCVSFVDPRMKYDHHLNTTVLPGHVNASSVILHRATLQREKAIVKSFVNKDVSLHDGFERTILHLGMKQNPDFLHFMLTTLHDIEINAIDLFGWTPLHYAARYYSPQCILLLLQNGASPLSETKTGLTVLHCMCMRSDAFDDADEKLWEEVLCYFSLDRNLQSRDILMRTPLHVAAKYSHTPFVLTYLVRHGANLTARDLTGETPLDIIWTRMDLPGTFMSELQEHLDKKRLIQLCPCTYANSLEGRLVLHVKTPASLESLLSRPQVFGNTSLTPSQRLHKAILNADRVTTFELLRQGYSLDDPDFGSELHLALSTGNDSFIRFLVEDAQLNVNVSDAYGWTPLHVAARDCSIRTIVTLVRANAGLCVRNSSGSTPLHYFAARKFRDWRRLAAVWVMCKLLEETDVNTLNESKETPLHYACQASVDYHVVRFLLSHGADYTLCTIQGYSPMDLANIRVKEDSDFSDVAVKIVTVLQGASTLGQCHCGYKSKNQQQQSCAEYHVGAAQKLSARELTNMVQRDNFMIGRALLDVTLGDAMDHTVRPLLSLTRKPFDFFVDLLNEEMASAKDIFLLLRHQSPATKFLQLSLSFAPRTILQPTIQRLSRFCRKKFPELAKKEKTAMGKGPLPAALITEGLRKFVTDMLQLELPPMVCKLCYIAARTLYKAVTAKKGRRRSRSGKEVVSVKMVAEKKKGQSAKVAKADIKRWVVANIVFLHYFLPVVVSPAAYMAIKPKQTPPMQVLLLASKLLLKLANGSEFADIDHNGAELTEVIHAARPEYVEYCDSVWTRGKVVLSSEVIPATPSAQDLRRFVTTCSTKKTAIAVSLQSLQNKTMSDSINFISSSKLQLKFTQTVFQYATGCYLLESIPIDDPESGGVITLGVDQSHVSGKRATPLRTMKPLDKIKSVTIQGRNSHRQGSSGDLSMFHNSPAKPRKLRETGLKTAASGNMAAPGSPRESPEGKKADRARGKERREKEKEKEKEAELLDPVLAFQLLAPQEFFAVNATKEVREKVNRDCLTTIRCRK